MSEITFYLDKQSKYRARIVAANNEIIFSSHQGFTSQRACIDNLLINRKALRDWNIKGPRS